jgi:lipoprotein-anchoring transpeptidase ErfK/SrfK
MQPRGRAVRRRRYGPIERGSPMTTSQTSRPGVERAAIRRRGRAAAIAAVLAFALAVATIWQLSASASSAGRLAAPPAPAPSPDAAPALAEPAPRPPLPPPADHPSDDGVVPPPPARLPEEPEAATPPDSAVGEAPTVRTDEPPAAIDEPTTPADEPSAPTEEPSELPGADAEPAGPAERPGQDAVDLAAVQSRLRELGYLLGPADGVRGQQTVAAVMAFQRVNGLGVDGVVGPRTLAALESPAAPELRGGAATRIEVDLGRQLAHVVRDGTRVVTLHVSSGNGETYRSSSGGTAQARTPVGTFRIERRIHGERHAALGVLYDPLYFHGGYAIHGSNSVPAYPASHGCVRVTRADARWLITNVADGTPVELYGGTHVFTPSR